MYTLILMSSRKNSVHQHTINGKHISFFSVVLLLLFVGAIGGINYGIFQKRQRAVSEEELRASAEEQIERLTQEKRKIESELANVNQEMNTIHQMVVQIQEALGILGQGGGNSSVSHPSEGSEESVRTEQENGLVPDGASDARAERQVLPTPNIVKNEISILHRYISEHQKQVDEYPSILPVNLEQEDGEKHVYWYSSQFGWRDHPLTKKREFHQGLDIKTQPGVPVIAAADGAVVMIKQKDYLGKTIEIEHEALLLKTLYAHLQGYAEGLKVGQKVTRGQVIGYVGNTGRSTGPHLHYGIYDMQKEQWVNPIKYILDRQPTFSP